MYNFYKKKKKRKIEKKYHFIIIFIESMAVNNWKGSLHFTPGKSLFFWIIEFYKLSYIFVADACPLQIFLVQLENYHFDLLTAVDITDVLLQFVQYILQADVIPLRSETLNSCNCCMKLLRFTIKTLCKCTEANLTTIENFNSNDFPMPKEDFCNLNAICAKHSLFNTRPSKLCIHEIYKDKFSDENSWSNMKKRQSKVLRDGIKFLSHVAICDPDFIIRLPDIEDSFHLFMRNLSAFKNFVFHENERKYEYIYIGKSTIMLILKLPFHSLILLLLFSYLRYGPF